MEHQNLGLRCSNCGSNLPERATAAASESAQIARCVVCDCEQPPLDARLRSPLTIGEFESQISEFILDARRRGLETTEIVRILSEELAFTAELTRVGRRISVQIIDLGPSDSEFDLPDDPTARDLLNSRQFLA